MGACWIQGTFVASDGDWDREIRRIQDEAEEYFGSRDGYSGAANSVNFSYAGDKSSLTKKELEKYLRHMEEQELDKRCGCVVRLGSAGFYICKTKINTRAEFVNDILCDMVRESKSPWILVKDSGLLDYKVLASGTLCEMKKQAHSYLRKIKYAETVYVVSRNKKIAVSGEIKKVGKTSRKTTDNILVVPMSRYLYFGWAPE